MTAPAITHEYLLASTPERAFAVYTDRIGEWWHPQYTANAETLESVTMEPHVGGRVYATHSDVGENDWGEVTVWEPGARLVHSFHLAQDPAHPSEVSVSFDAEGDGCRVRFAHGGWTDENVGVREKFGDWSLLLDRYAALADGSSSALR